MLLLLKDATEDVRKWYWRCRVLPPNPWKALVVQILHMLAVILFWLTMTSIHLYHHGLLGLAIRELALILIFTFSTAGAMPSQGYRSCLYASPLIRIVDFSVGIAVRLGCECVLFVRSYWWSILLRSPSTDFCMHPQFRLQVESNSSPLWKSIRLLLQPLLLILHFRKDDSGAKSNKSATSLPPYHL